MIERALYLVLQDTDMGCNCYLALWGRPDLDLVILFQQWLVEIGVRDWHTAFLSERDWWKDHYPQGQQKAFTDWLQSARGFETADVEDQITLDGS